jgi:hypothetical protein
MATLKMYDDDLTYQVDLLDGTFRVLEHEWSPSDDTLIALRGEADTVREILPLVGTYMPLVPTASENIVKLLELARLYIAESWRDNAVWLEYWADGGYGTRRLIKGGYLQRVSSMGASQFLDQAGARANLVLDLQPEHESLSYFAAGADITGGMWFPARGTPTYSENTTPTSVNFNGGTLDLPALGQLQGRVASLNVAPDQNMSLFIAGIKPTRYGIDNFDPFLDFHGDSTLSSWTTKATSETNYTDAGYVRVIPTATGTWASTCYFTLSNLTEYYGTHRVFVRCKYDSTNTETFGMRVRAGAFFASLQQAATGDAIYFDTAYVNTTWFWADLGTITIPLSARRNVITPGYDITIQMTQLAGTPSTQDMYLDRLVLMPYEHFFEMRFGANVPSTDTVSVSTDATGLHSADADGATDQEATTLDTNNWGYPAEGGKLVVIGGFWDFIYNYRENEILTNTADISLDAVPRWQGWRNA